MLLPRLLIAALVTLTLGLTGAAVAAPASLSQVRDAMIALGVKSVDVAILSGQPTLSGELDGMGIVVALRACQSIDTGERLCGETAFKACRPLTATGGMDRAARLEEVNQYNLGRYAGTMTLDDHPALGPVFCVVDEVNLRDENDFGSEEAYEFAQALTDFRSFLLDRGVPVENPESL